MYARIVKAADLDNRLGKFDRSFHFVPLIIHSFVTAS